MDQIERSNKSFPFYQFKGTHREIGRQYGEVCRDLILQHLQLVMIRLKSKFNVATQQQVEEAALQYRSYVLEYAPFLDEEIQGLAEGAGISLGEAYLLQVRAELNQIFQIQHNECTTFAVAGEATADGIPLVGQNADLPAFYTDISVVIELIPDNGPACLMLTPAGQVSYIGINDLGMGVFANFLTCEGWRLGFPRYMLSRLALTCGTVEEAVTMVERVHRASSRNLIMLDSHGGMANLETLPTRTGRIEPTNGLLAHSNHIVAEELLEEERLMGIELENSQVRIKQMYTLLSQNHGKINVEVMKDICRDRTSYPHCLCQIHGDEGMQSPGDKAPDIITFASFVAKPSKGRAWIAMGPPDQYEYKCYELSRNNVNQWVEYNMLNK
ncbi:C45 family peptidase [Ammoniphilus sp. CFH 90114]|uniref:C45 family autoproteolytic acyltransferase/hydolase n=1 Tax=Ammoniphilus sp. CFH 90114 TaxID=2493665 RepID=UPI00100EF862|nr:C45 family peptidase [Ammoniphilus sp. CFH 90114]RXT02301.1 hypothetical protein EIZ39_25145 [Ammoniphilus sp. CFH 90114]